MDLEVLLLKLVCAGLYGDSRYLVDFPRLSEHEWLMLYRETKRQTVSGIALAALDMLPEPLFPPRDLLLRWVARGDRIERMNRNMARALKSLTAMFEQAGLHPVLQKGLAVARFYNQPRLRVSGDIDICFTATERLIADQVVAGQVTHTTIHPDGSLVYRWQGIEVEHHTRLIDISSPLHQKQLTAPPYTLTTTIDIDDARVNIPAPLAELLMINTHIMKHCLGMGIGLRHFCDYAVARQALLPTIGVENYRKACHQLGITRWTTALDSFIDTYLNPDPQATPVEPTKMDRRLFAMMSTGGNFGLHRGGSERRQSRTVIRRKFGTMSSFMRSATLSLRLAPAEAMATFISLLRGQL